MKLGGNKIILIVVLVVVIVLLIICLRLKPFKYKIKVESSLEQLPNNEVFSRVYIKNLSNRKITIKTVFSKLLGRPLHCVLLASAGSRSLCLNPGDHTEFGGPVILHYKENRQLEEEIVVEIEEGAVEIIDTDNTDVIIFEPEIIEEFEPLIIPTPIIPTCAEFDPTGLVYEPYSTEEPGIVNLPYETFSMFSGILDDGRRFTGTFLNVMMWNADGTRDLTFGTDGMWNDGGSELYYASTDGVNIYVSIREGAFNYSVGKLLPNGTLDLSYGVAGKYMSSTTNQLDRYVKFKHLDDGSILVLTTGTITSPIMGSVHKILSDGTPDLTFGNNGIASLTAVINTNFSVADIEYHKPTGHIYVASQNNKFSQFLEVYRLLGNGAIDTSYGVSGEFSIDRVDPPLNLCPFNNLIRSVRSVGLTLGPDESIYLNIVSLEPLSTNGGCSNSEARILTVLKLDPNGSIDTSWGTNGVYKDLNSRPITSNSNEFVYAPQSGWISTEDNSLTILTVYNKPNTFGVFYFSLIQIDENGQLMSGDQNIDVFELHWLSGSPTTINQIIPTGNGTFFFTTNTAYRLSGVIPPGEFSAGEFCYPKITYGERNRPW
jgi:hypothetical protein